jgi:phosphate/sulfate permease
MDARKVEWTLRKIDTLGLNQQERKDLKEVRASLTLITTKVKHPSSSDKLDSSGNFVIRKSILLISQKVESLLKSSDDKVRSTLGPLDVALLNSKIKKMKGYTEYAPRWVILMVSLSLGLGTMIGWKKIVVTIGEKIGKTHLTYAQGAGAQIIAASTISASSLFGLPVSTTHVLSSGVAGSMVAGRGRQNLQMGTVKNILAAWLFTLPVTIVLSGGLFLLLRTLL